MRILVTEAASPLAYHVTSLVAAGEVFPGQQLELVLCDHRENLDRLTGLAYELEDCVHPLLKDVSISCDFLSEFQTADVVLVLPNQSPRPSRQTQVHMDYSLLREINFNGLDCVFHHRGLDMQEQVTVSALGTLSSAVKITSCLSNIYLSAEKEALKTRLKSMLSREEAEFGMPPVAEGWSMAPVDQIPSSRDDENRLLVMLVSVTDCDTQDSSVKSINNLNIKLQTMSRL